jgi:hypothetical protein
MRPSIITILASIISLVVAFNSTFNATLSSQQQCIILGNTSAFAIANSSAVVPITTYCNAASFLYTQIVDVFYVNDFDECLQTCEDYESPLLCKGITFHSDTPGPSEIGGYLCELVWNTSTGPSTQLGALSAVLEYGLATNSNSSMVHKETARFR